VGATYTPLFSASEIRVEGAAGIPRAVLLRIAGLANDPNVFHLDTHVAERRLLDDPRILEARVTTALPDTVLIDIVRRVPVAVVGAPASLVGADGVVIGPARGSPDLPSLLTETGGPVAVADRELAAAAAAAMTPDLRRAVEAVVVDPDGGLEVRLTVGFSAYLGEGSELVEKAASLGALLDWVTEQGVTVVSADLTVPGSPTAQLESHGTPVPVP
jgi:cell division protein FtsQ